MLFFSFLYFCIPLKNDIRAHYITRFLHVHPFQYDVICLLLISVTEFTCSNSVGPLLKIWISFKSHCSHWQMIFLLFHWSRRVNLWKQVWYNCHRIMYLYLDYLIPAYNFFEVPSFRIFAVIVWHAFKIIYDRVNGFLTTFGWNKTYSTYFWIMEEVVVVCCTSCCYYCFNWRMRFQTFCGLAFGISGIS